MERNVIRWLRISYWAGALVDFGAGWMMLVPGLSAFMHRPEVFQPGNDYHYAMGVGAPLMFGWTVLLLWADRKPFERRGILPLTLLVIFGEIVNQVWGISVGFLIPGAVVPMFVMQAILICLFCFAYFRAWRMQ